MYSFLTQPGTFVVGCNYWASHAGTEMWSDWQPEVVAADLRQLAEGGLQVLRVFPLWPDFQPLVLLRGGGGQPREYRLRGPAGEQPLPDNAAGQAGVSAAAIDRFQAFADLAEQNQLKLIVGLLTGWMSGRLFVPPAFEGLNVLTDPAAIQWETRFVRYFVRHFKDHPAIAAWDLGNECNVMAAVPSPAAAWNWVSAITNAIRVEDRPANGQSHPIVSGMHGSLEDWSPASLGELTDVLTTHPYPVWTRYCDQDPVNTIRPILHSTAESRLYADWGGKPCLAEELGTLGPMLGADAIAADFVRTCLFSLWAQDVPGLLWWCAYDQDRLAQAPYDWNTCERELGLIRSDRSPRPALAALGSFRRFLEGLPFAALPPQPQEAVCLLSLDQDPWAVAFSSFILARQAGFQLSFQQGEQPLKAAQLYLAPSVRGINVISRHRWLELLERVRAGAALYVSLDEALLPAFRETFGVEVQTRERTTGPMTLQIPGVGGDLTCPAPFRLNLKPAGAEILGREPGGNPAFTRFSYGAGQVYLLTAPIERALTETPGSFHDPSAQPFWQIYQTLAAPLLETHAVRKANPLLGLSEHPTTEIERVVVAINYSPDPVHEKLTVAPGWQTASVWRGELKADRLSLPPNDAAVFLIRKI